MGPKFAVRDDSVNKHASNLDTSVSALNAQAAAFTQAIEPLEGQWQGTSFGSWHDLTTAWHSSMKDLNAALSSIRSRVGNAGHLYDQFEAEQARSLQTTMGSANWDGTKFRG